MCVNYSDNSSTHMVSWVVDGEASEEHEYKHEGGTYDIKYPDKDYYYNYHEFKFEKFDITPVKIPKGSKLHIRMKYTGGEDYQRRVY